MPATGLEAALPFKPDHDAVQMQIDLKKIKQGFHGQPDYEEPTETDGITIANRYLEAKARHSGAWTYALVARDVETLWPLWCRAAEHALGLPVGSRGSLLLTRRSLAEPVPVEEAVESAKQQATVTKIKRRLADTGVVTFFDWPAWLGPHPPTAVAQTK
eukprot:3862086-Amphidinium_carterae.1